MNKELLLSILLYFWISLPIKAQVVNEPLLGMDEAINTALKNNTDISVAYKEVEAAKNEATPWNAGFLPSLSAQGSHQREIKDTRIEFATTEFPDINRENAQIQTTDASVGFNYNLFGGLEKFYTYSSLKKQLTIAELQAKLAMENQLSELINIYLQTSNLEQEVLVNERALEISSDRVLRIEEQFELGAVSRLELLQARVDLNSDSISLAESIGNLLNIKRDLIVQMGQDPRTEFTVENEFQINKQLSLDSILTLAYSQSTQLRLARIQRDRAQLQRKIANATYYPRLNLSLEYAYFRTENEAGFVRQQQTNGPQGSISVSYNIFNGFQQRIRRQNADIQIETTDERIAQTKKQLERDVKNTYTNYLKSLKMLNMAVDDIEVGRLNFDRAFEAYRTGAINGLELRQAQLNYLQALLRRHRIMTQAKQAEVQLYRLAGILVD